jgi:hypothetical protein
MMRILGRLMDELFTDIEIVIDQIPGREFELEDRQSFRLCPIVEAPAGSDEDRKRIYFLGGPCPGGSIAVLSDGHGCTIRIERRVGGYIIIEIQEDGDSPEPPEPRVYADLLGTGKTYEFTDCHGRAVTVTRLRRRVSRKRLRELGVVV